MGFYDVRCGASGLSLRDSDACLFLIRQSNKGFAPVALPVFGQYNSLGTIEMIREGYNTERIHKKLLKLIEEGLLVLEESALYERETNPINNIEDTLRIVERACTEEEEYVTYRGKPLVFMLVSELVYQAVVELVAKDPRWAKLGAALEALPLPELFERAFGGLEPAPTLYGDIASAPEETQKEARRDLLAFLRFRAWFEPEGKWKHASTPPRHYDEHVRRYLRGAKKRFLGEPSLLRALARYAKAQEIPRKVLGEEVASLIDEPAVVLPDPSIPVPPVGGRVRHPKFGQGVITAVSGIPGSESDGLKLNVKFDENGTRLMLASFLEVLSPAAE